MRLPLVVNCFGASGVGKSTNAAGVFYKLKMAGINCELITEFAKDLVWENNLTALQNQLFTSANQIYRQERLEKQVEVIVTDSPILLGSIYWSDKNSQKYHHFKSLLLEIFNEKNNLNFYLVRKHKYSNVGRVHTEDQSKEVDKKLHKFLDDNKIPYVTVEGTPKGLEEIYETIVTTLNRIKE